MKKLIIILLALIVSVFVLPGVVRGAACTGNLDMTGFDYSKSNDNVTVTREYGDGGPIRTERHVLERDDRYDYDSSDSGIPSRKGYSKFIDNDGDDPDTRLIVRINEGDLNKGLYSVTTYWQGNTSEACSESITLAVNGTYPSPKKDDPTSTPPGTTGDTEDPVTPFVDNTPTPHGRLDDPTWSTVFGGATCPDPNKPDQSGYECWINLVWNWAMLILVPLSVLILSAAGVIYVTSEGDSDRVSLAKKMIVGVASGVGLLVLSRVLLAIIGVEDKAWNITLNIVRSIWFV